LRSLEVPPFEVKDELKTYILEGWENDGKHVDWYELMCAFFQEELKTNPHLSTIIQTNLLTNLNKDISGLQLSLDAFLKPLQDFFEEYKGILLLLDEINEKLDELPAEIQRIVREELQNTELETLPRFDLDSQYKKMNQDIQDFTAELSEIQQEIEDIQADIQDLPDSERKTRKERNLQRLFKNRLETSQRKNQLTQNRDNFIKDIIKIAESLPKQPASTTTRLKKVKAYFDSGNLSKAITAFNEPEMNQELQIRLAEKEENQQKLKNIADEYLMLARLTATNYDLGKKRYETAKKYFEQSLKADRNAENIFAFAYFLQENKQVLKAIKLYKEELEIYRRQSQHNGEDTQTYLLHLATILNNRANLQCTINEYKQAETAYQEVLEIYQKLAKVNPQIYSPYIAGVLNNLGLLHSAKNEFKQSEQFYLTALEMRRKFAKVDSETHLSGVAETLNNLGLLQSAKNEFKEAEKSYREALAIKRELAKIASRTYLPYVADTLNNLANLYRVNNEIGEAEQAHKEALIIRRKFAESNPQIYLSKVANTLNNLANLQSDKDEFKQAEQSYEEALKIYQQLAQFNPKAYLHEVGTTLNNLGAFHHYKGEFEQAEKFYGEALEVYQKLTELLSQDQPQLAATIVNLSMFYCYDYPMKEKSVELAVKVIKIATQFQDIPIVQEYKGSAIEVLQNWGIDWRGFLKEDDIPKE